MCASIGSERKSRWCDIVQMSFCNNFSDGQKIRTDERLLHSRAHSCDLIVACANARTSSNREKIKNISRVVCVFISFIRFDRMRSVMQAHFRTSHLIDAHVASIVLSPVRLLLLRLLSLILLLSLRPRLHRLRLWMHRLHRQLLYFDRSR